MSVKVSGLRFEHHREPLGIGEGAPRLSWQVTAAPENWRQNAYEVEVDGTSTVVESEESVLVPWPAPLLASRDRRAVRVRVRGEAWSGFSDLVTVEVGLTSPADWHGVLITPEVDARGPAALLRQEFSLAGEIASARLYATAHGIYTAEINGIRVGRDAFAPGWTSYAHRLRVQTYDVTDLVRVGANAVGATVADGWYRGRLTFVAGKHDVYGDKLGLLAQLEVTYADGRTQVIGTDPTWRASTGPVRVGDLYEGEHYDARLERIGWSTAGYDDRDWTLCAGDDLDFGTLTAPDGPPVRATEEVAVTSISTSPSGRTLLDFGQNLVGRLRINVAGPAGTEITLRHAEVLEHGELGVRPLRTATATDRYILRGGAPEVWEPEFTFHGFRYAEVSGWPGELRPEHITAVVYHSDLVRTGWFDCSDQLLNRLHDNVIWGMRGNFVDLPTDCPQRDERLGWTGDIQVFAPTATSLYDCAGFLTSWMKDLTADQTDEGIVSVFVPRIDLSGPFGEPQPQAGWGDAAVIVPWVLYQRVGDTGILRQQYASMRAWVDGVTRAVGEGALFDQPPFQLGDWLDPAAPPDNPAAASTDPILASTAYRVWAARLLSRIAGVLGEDDDAGTYAALADRVRDGFHDEYVSPRGRIASDSQTAYAMALEFGLLPDQAQRQRAADRLVEIVRTQGHRIATGFLGTPLICDALTTAGAVDDAYQLLLQTKCPSWLYPVTMGATTIWERWDSMLPDGTINPGGMTSFNHYALGAVADWMHRVIGGLAPAAPGFRKILVRPRPGGCLESASVAHLTPYGRAAVSWQRANGRLAVDVEIPVGTTARVELPDIESVEVGPGRHHFDAACRGPADDPKYKPAFSPEDFE